MKLEYGATTLGDESSGDVIMDHGGPNQRVVQVEPLLGGDAPFLAGRNNHSNERSFTVALTHNTAEDAVEWFNAHPDSLADSDTLKITEGSYSCETTALLQRVERVEFSGLTTLLRYSFITQRIEESEA